MTVLCWNVTNAVAKCSSSQAVSVNTLGVLNAPIPANCCATENQRRQRQTLYPCPSCCAKRLKTTTCLETARLGIFLAASQFPKHRETIRAPLVAEIKPHANELDPKFRYLLAAPEQDPEGNPAVIRYSRKTKEQYVQSELEGKATGWKAFYQEPNWVEEGEVKKPGR